MMGWMWRLRTNYTRNKAHMRNFYMFGATEFMVGLLTEMGPIGQGKGHMTFSRNLLAVSRQFKESVTGM